MTDWSILGITENEFRVYETLLKHGASTISSLANKVHLNERSVYDYIERLIHKGLVGQIIHNNKRMFLGLNPKMLSYYIEEEKKKIEEQINSLKKIASKGNEDIHANIISSKSDFLKFIKSSKGIDEVFIGARSKDIISNPNFKFCIKNNKPKITLTSKKNTSSVYSNASIIALFSEELFLIYSIPEEKGFFIKDKEFTKSMRVYFR